MGRLLTPGRIEGFLVLAALLCLANALLLAGILGHFFRGSQIVPVAAAALLIVNPCDYSRFFVMWTTNYYWMALFFLLLAVRLYLASHESGSRARLAAACVALLAAGLTSEGGLPLACLAPPLLWLSGRNRARFLPWAFAWYGTLALLAARFLLHLLLLKESGYQSRLLASAALTPRCCSRMPSSS